VNRKSTIGIVSCILVFVAAGFLTGCGGVSSGYNTPAAITAGTGVSGQSARVGTAFTTGFTVTVTNSDGRGVSGVLVTFTAPASGASGTFASNGTATETDTTNSNGVAIASTYTANSTAGSYTVVVTAGSVTGSIALTNTAGATGSLTISSGSGQSASVSTAFANPLVANVVNASSIPVEGVQVTFAAPSTGASGTFANSGTATETDFTDANGNATSSAFTANGTVGGPYNVVASTTGLTAVNFAETNTAAVTVSSATYVYYVSGWEKINETNSNPNYYTIAGAVTIDADGNILGGEQDYSDGMGNTSPGEPSTPDTIYPLTQGLSVNPTTGTGTLTIATGNPNIGVNVENGGILTFAVQFVNANHARIMQFDGTATSSGSLDLQTSTGATGNFAFAITGVDHSYESIGYGGIFTASNTGISGTLDVNDGGTLSTGTSFTASSTGADIYGRSIVTGITNPVASTSITFASYVVGPEVMRIIDIDTSDTVPYDAGVGSAYGQGSAAFSNASLGTSVFNETGQWSEIFETAGEFTTTGDGVISGGLADINEQDNEVQQAVSGLSGTYSINSSGYGSIALSGDADITALGVYMTDPNLNLNDPNNTATDLGGALIVDMSTASPLPGGMGVITPQASSLTASDFSGTYVTGFQAYNYWECGECFIFEADMVGVGTMTSGGPLAITAQDSDPFGTWDGTPAESSGDSFTSTPIPASRNGYNYFSMYHGNSPANTLAATINGVSISPSFDVDTYAASATTLYWLQFDVAGAFVGALEAQGSLTGVPNLSTAMARTQPRSTAKAATTVGGSNH
jgi:hypothetical protein